MMLNSGAEKDTVSDIIEAQIACTARLVEVLDSEHTALLVNDLEGLHQACLAKAMAAAHLQQLGDRMNLKSGNAATRVAMEGFLGQLDGASTLLQRWQDLGRLAGRCNTANLANGALIEVREAQVRGALAALQPETPALYGRHGVNRPIRAGQIISRA